MSLRGALVTLCENIDVKHQQSSFHPDIPTPKRYEIALLSLAPSSAVLRSRAMTGENLCNELLQLAII